MRSIHGIPVLIAAAGVAAAVGGAHVAGAQMAHNAPSEIADVASHPTGFADLVAKLQPAVVNISAQEKVTAKQQNPFAGTPFGDLFGGDGGPTTHDALSLGSGFIISADGFVVTNNHVLTGGDAEDSKGVVLQSVTVTLPDRTEYTAHIVGRDALADIAVLKIDTPHPLPFVRFGDSTHARVGDWVLAIGNPFALGGTVTAGIVSAIHRTIGDIGPYHRFIQTDAAINSGNSGGPLFDMSGEVIGINNIIQAAGGAGNIGIGFAIPSEEAKPVVDVLMRGGKVRRGYLGVTVQPVDDDMASALGLPKNQGEIVARVEPNSPAARAGIEQGDVIVTVNRAPITPDDTLTYSISNLAANARVSMDIFRHGSRISVTAIIIERPTESSVAEVSGAKSPDAGASNQTASNALDATLQTLSQEAAKEFGVPPNVSGVLIAKVAPDSDLASNGVKRGDVILSINQQPATTVPTAIAALAAAERRGRASVLLLLQRGTDPAVYVGIKLVRR